MFKYQLYTLNIESDILLLGYPPVKELTQVDYHLKLVSSIKSPKAGIPNAVYKPWSVACPDFYYLNIEGICTFLVQAEGVIELYIYPDSSEADALPFFHDTILTAALIFRSKFTLKASGVKRPTTNTANLFCANNGGGKSTLATVLTHNGYHFIEDNRALLNWDESKGYFTIKNHHPKLEIWNNVAQEFLQSKIYKKRILFRSHPVRPGLLKGFYKVAGDIVTEPIKISNCFLITLINEDEPTSMAPVTGLKKASVLIRHLHHHELIRSLGKFKEGFAFVSKLVQQIEVLAINRAENAPFVDFVHLVVKEMGLDVEAFSEQKS